MHQKNSNNIRVIANIMRYYYFWDYGSAHDRKPRGHCVKEAVHCIHMFPLYSRKAMCTLPHKIHLPEIKLAFLRETMYNTFGISMYGHGKGVLMDPAIGSGSGIMPVLTLFTGTLIWFCCGLAQVL